MSDVLSPQWPILLVDDEVSLLRSLSLTLKRQGKFNNIIQCSDSRAVMSLLAEQKVSAVVLDLMMPHLTGEELLPQIIAEYPDLPVIVLSGLNQIEAAVRCIRNGAYDYFVKASEVDRLLNGLQRAIDLHALPHSKRELAARFLDLDLKIPEAFVSTITRTERMKTIFRYVETVALSHEPLLITGESGVGKELIARSYHRICGPSLPWVPVNLAALDDAEINPVLFGEVKGSKAQEGMIKQAGNGILFLDEIGDISDRAQLKLLRLFREREYIPLGSAKSVRIQAKIVCATNQDLAARVADGRFRKDLYYKLMTHHVCLPPLRERKEDIPLLIPHFFAQLSRLMNKKIPAYPPELAQLLSTYDFPGNIQELKSMIAAALAGHKSRIISLNTFKEAIGFRAGPDVSSPAKGNDVSLPPLIVPEKMPTLNEAAAYLVEEALRRSSGNQSIAAGLLGITRQALGQRLKKLSH